jgi:membrane glycosyltransferase
MLDRPPSQAVAAGSNAASMTRRRALYALMVGATTCGLLGLAAAAVPPRSFGAVAFLVLFAVTLPWTTIGFWNAAIGFLVMCFSKDPATAVNPMAAGVRGDEPLTASTAILICIRNEDPSRVKRNLQPLLEGLKAAEAGPHFHVYILSDSSAPAIIAAEYACFAPLIAAWRDAIAITYRRRPLNTGFKAGNIEDFCDRWGGAHDYAIVFDADSYVPADRVLRLVRIMQANPTLGILQTLVVGLPSMSAFARLFQFGMRLGMHAHTVGAAWWQGDCGPYWGHNAILRLQPFAAHCRMPVLPEGGPLGGHVLSHDQIEAAMMRRAGYEVRVLPVDGVSWEENPPSVIDFIRRELRWCQGNMQYFQLLNLPGLKPVSRFQLVFAILMYLGSPAWMAMLALGAATIAFAASSHAPALRATPAGAALFAIMLAMIFAPKIATALDVLARRSARDSYGGAGRFLANVVAETLFTFLLSPVMSLAHTIFLFRLFVLRRGYSWSSQKRDSEGVAWSTAWSRLWPQTVVGLAVMAIIAVKAPGDVVYAFVIAGGLALAVPFAVLTASPRVGRLFARVGVGCIPEEVEPPDALLPLRLPALEILEALDGRAPAPALLEALGEGRADLLE